MNLQPNDIIERCKQAFAHTRQKIAEGTAYLFEIERDSLWKGHAESWSEFCEQDLQISRSLASKLLTNWKTYVIEGQNPPNIISDIDTERLYLASRIPDTTVEERLEIAKGNSRRDIRVRLSGEEDCQHEEIIQVCAKCHARV